MICTYAGECITVGGKLRDRQALLWKQCERRDLPTSFQEKVAYLYDFSKAFLKLLHRINRLPVILTFPSESVEMSLRPWANNLKFQYKIHGEDECNLYYPEDSSSTFLPVLTLVKNTHEEYTYQEQLPMQPPSPDAESLVDALLSSKFHTGQPKTMIRGKLWLTANYLFDNKHEGVFFMYI